MKEADSLARVSVFSSLVEVDLERIAGLTRRHIFREGEVITREGDRDGRLFIVVRGQVEVVKNLGEKDERRLRALGPHTYFGEMALIDDLVRSASVVARQETELLSLEQLDFREEIGKCPSIAIELLQTLSRRIRTIEESMEKILGTLLPICASCKKIRVDDEVWTPIEVYITDHSKTEFSHGICPECARELYPELYGHDS